jgi:hypothetical protein
MRSRDLDDPWTGKTGIGETMQAAVNDKRGRPSNQGAGCVGGFMRTLRNVCAVMLGVVIGLPGCGSDSGDQLVLSFERFTNEGITQSDVVFDTHAEVDICPFLCDDLTAEPYMQTTVGAVFTNHEKANIRLQSYTLLVPGSGIEEITRPITALIPGGRCNDISLQPCALDSECGLDGSCVHTQTTVTFLLYDIDFKQRVLLGRCPGLVYDEEKGGYVIVNADAVIPQTLTALLTFTGVDDRDESWTVTAAYQSTFDNFNACED